MTFGCNPGVALGLAMAGAGSRLPFPKPISKQWSCSELQAGHARLLESKKEPADVPSTKDAIRAQRQAWHLGEF